MTNTKDLNRIKIGDEWYVKESLVTATIGSDEQVLPEIIWTKCGLIENDEYVFEACVLTDDEFDSPDMLSITYTDKRVWGANREKDWWDNDVFLKGLLDEDEYSWAQLSEISLSTKKDLLWFLKELRNVGWL
jgi:hypothetical protein